MFANAIKTVSAFTLPVVISKRFYGGQVECGCATFIVLNKDGWALTSAHVMNDLLESQKHAKEIVEHEKKKAEIESNTTLSRKQKNKKIKKLNINNRWIINCSYWWGIDHVGMPTFFGNPYLDLATGKLEPFDGRSVSLYPTFMNPGDELPVGTSLCRLGFPFHSIKATFDEAKNAFQLAPGTVPLPRFPIEGIHTRVAVLVDQATKKQTKFIETSSPGLRGQSGGPIFDVHGNIWGLQSRTTNLPLGFSPKVKRGNREIEENQFLNLGYGTHVEEIITFLKQNGVKFNLTKPK